jgi:hypothetical protein
MNAIIQLRINKRKLREIKWNLIQKSKGSWEYFEKLRDTLQQK